MSDKIVGVTATSNLYCVLYSGDVIRLKGSQLISLGKVSSSITAFRIYEGLDNFVMVYNDAEGANYCEFDD